MVISGVADRVPHRLRRLVFLDAVIIENGQTLGGATLVGGAAALPPMPASSFGITDATERAWVESNLTPHPANTFSTPLHLTNPLGNGLRCIYVACTRPSMYGVSRYLQMARSRLGWLPADADAAQDPRLRHRAALIGRNADAGWREFDAGGQRIANDADGSAGPYAFCHGDKERSGPCGNSSEQGACTFC